MKAQMLGPLGQLLLLWPRLNSRGWKDKSESTVQPREWLRLHQNG